LFFFREGVPPFSKRIGVLDVPCHAWNMPLNTYPVKGGGRRPGVAGENAQQGAILLTQLLCPSS
jgi:hypothetical protein